eukprot:scaffold245183_cov33-Prasinocladus_malaysianus.AAC.1
MFRCDRCHGILEVTRPSSAHLCIKNNCGKANRVITGHETEEDRDPCPARRVPSVRRTPYRNSYYVHVRDYCISN